MQTPIPVPFTAITTTLLLMPNSDSIGGVESYSIIVDPTVEEIASVEGAFSPWDEGKNTISATSSNFAGSSGYKSRPRSLMTIGHDGFGSVTLLEFVGGPVESGTLLEAVKLGSKVANGRLKWVEGVVKRGNKDAEEKELAEVRKDKAVEKEKEMDDGARRVRERDPAGVRWGASGEWDAFGGGEVGEQGGEWKVEVG